MGGDSEGRCFAIARWLQVCDKGVDCGFVLRVGQSEVDTVEIEIACAGAADTGRGALDMLFAYVSRGTDPPEAPVTSASLPLSSLSAGMAVARPIE